MIIYAHFLLIGLVFTEFNYDVFLNNLCIFGLYCLIANK